MGSRGSSRWALVCLASLAAANSGCVALMIASAHKEEVDRTDVDVRVSRHRADVSGTLCYVEKRSRVVSRIHVDQPRPLRRAGALIEVLAGGAVLLAERLDYTDTGPAVAASPSPPYGLIPIADGVSALAYYLFREGSVSTSESWELSSDTASCAP